MSAPDRRAMVERPEQGPVGAPPNARLWAWRASGVYRPKPVAEADDLR